MSARLNIRQPDAGEDRNQRVAAAIGKAEAFVLLVGAGAGPDRQQRCEWQQSTGHESYLDANKPMVPVIIGSPAMPIAIDGRRP